jgi:hypothetical protein
MPQCGVLLVVRHVCHGHPSALGSPPNPTPHPTNPTLTLTGPVHTHAHTHPEGAVKVLLQHLQQPLTIPWRLAAHDIQPGVCGGGGGGAAWQGGVSTHRRL